MKKVLIIKFLIFLLYKNCYSQYNFFGVSMTKGYKSAYQGGGITAYGRIKNHLDIEFGSSFGMLSGVGYCASIRYVPFKTKLQPFVGVQYSKNFGVKSFDVHIDTSYTYYKINRCEFYYLNAGLTYRIRNKEEGRDNIFVLLILSTSYRFSPYSNNKVEYISGNLTSPYENGMNNKIGKGMGFSFSFVCLFGKKGSVTSSTFDK